MDSTKYIGMDVHKEATTIAVMNSAGKLVMEYGSQGGHDCAFFLRAVGPAVRDVGTRDLGRLVIQPAEAARD
jgi:hypothetical protein